MEAEQNNSEAEAYPEIEYVVRVKEQKRGFLGRVGCGLALAVWFGVLLLPTFFIILAVQGDITLRHRGDVPDKHRHPLLEVKLLMEPESRGLQFTNSSIERDNNELCIDTQVRYLLWQGEGDSARYCDCYTRASTDADWSYVSTEINACR